MVNRVHLRWPLAERRPPVSEDAPRGTEHRLPHAYVVNMEPVEVCPGSLFLVLSLTICVRIVFSPASAHIGAKRSVKELLWTTGGLHHKTTVVLSC